MLSRIILLMLLIILLIKKDSANQNYAALLASFANGKRTVKQAPCNCYCGVS